MTSSGKMDTRPSEQSLKDAYERMKVKDQPWAKHTEKEVAYIFAAMGSFAAGVHSVIDFGCGHGRHSAEIASKYAQTEVKGVDFSAANIRVARSRTKKLPNVSFSAADCRDIKERNRYDLAICLYDVVGSFPDEKDNAKIVSNLYNVLAPGGYMFLSVMNMELTEHSAHPYNIGPISKDPKILFGLPAGGVMQNTGNVFDPDYYAIDTETGLVFRKEQFGGDGRLPAEYVIRDKRYRRTELKKMIEDAGFEMIDMRCVRAGNWDEPLTPTDPKAKEILAVARKPFPDTER